jgi:hypothetical protein
MTTSILSRITPDMITLVPFPHIHVTECLDPALYAELAAAYPSMERIAGDGPYPNNVARRLPARDVMADTDLPAIWRDFFAYHSSQTFFDEYVALWRPVLDQVYPDLEERFGKPLSDLTTGVRNSRKKITSADNQQADVMLDCQFVINTPVTTSTSVRGPHIDHIHKLFNALLYFRRPDDESTGGNLMLYRAKTDRFYQDADGHIEDRYVEAVTTVPYAANTLIMMLNTDRGIHAVSPRSVTPIPRRHVNIHAECYKLKSKGFFPLKRTFAGRVADTFQRLAG